MAADGGLQADTIPGTEVDGRKEVNAGEVGDYNDDNRGRAGDWSVPVLEALYSINNHVSLCIFKLGTEAGLTVHWYF